ncbi:hypothetical protein OEB94_02495 [Streptomyces sp. ICN988]|uniref:hypothetical protein n=1 Tax=Streptomyces sp. ICN988 TaxID=2983765 RepID=UPI0021E4D989|nr:hypothetical protein [Streptomyces sp. ICN988]MCV2458160.1 hypothetical protein [Streptomyces sp. ICN988]
MPAFTSLLTRKLTASLKTSTRGARTGASQRLVAASQVRTCPYCGKWVAPQTTICPGGHAVG